MPLKLLAVGDLHLGRSPSRLPAELEHRARDLGPAGAWQRIVSAAADARVDALALAGDVVEQEDDFFEAYRELADGVDKLLKAGIRVLAVAGNHDVQVLPRLADQIDGFELLGRGGRWEAATLQAGSDRLTVHGWSFPQREVTTSPLSGQRFERGPGPNLALLHCDRDQRDSAYAPVASAELEAAALDGWLLGHIHAPDALTVARPAGYLGSATGLDPGEPGARGPWLLGVEGGRLAGVEQWALAPLAWERLDVDLTGIGAGEDARERLLEATNALDSRLAERPVPPAAAGLRVTFTGRTNLRRGVEDVLRAENLSSLYAGERGIHYFVERWSVRTRPELDLDALARHTNPPGLLARRLRLLERPAEDPERRELIERARAELGARRQKTYWQPLQPPQPDDDTLAQWLHDAGLAALDRLLAQDRAE